MNSKAKPPRRRSRVTWNPTAVSASRVIYVGHEAGLPSQRPRYGIADGTFWILIRSKMAKSPSGLSTRRTLRKSPSLSAIFIPAWIV